MMILLSSLAFAWESPAQEVVLIDERPLFEAVEVDTGWVPGGSPVAIAFRITADGGSYTEMEGESWLEWPPSLTHGYAPEPLTGIFLLDAELTASVDFLIDAGGVYYEDSLATSTTVVEGEAFFDPWLLDDGSGEVVWAEASSPGQEQTVIDSEFTVFTGVSAYIKVNWRIDALGAFTGERFTTTDQAGDVQVIDMQDGVELFLPPEGGLLSLESIFTGRYLADLDLVAVPEFGVCIDFVGCTEIASFDVPVPVVSDDFEADFETVALEHGVPVLDVDTLACDFGEVEIGQIAHCEVALTNLGAFDVEGTAGILGAGEFTVFPNDLLARMDTTDGITVTFAPTVEGEQIAALILNSNDPTKDALEIPLVGVGYVEDLPVISTEVGGCGCATGAPSHGWLGLLLAGFLLRRR